MTSVNNNSLQQAAKPASEATAIVDQAGKSSGRQSGNNKAKEVRNPRGKQDRQHKKDAKKCSYCGKLGHESDGCYKKTSDERVDEAVAVAVRVATALSSVPKAPAAEAAPAAPAEAAHVAEGDDADFDDDADWSDAPEDVVEIVGIGAADDGEFEDAVFDPYFEDRRSVVGIVRDLLLDFCDDIGSWIAWLPVLVVAPFGALAALLISLGSRAIRLSRAYTFTPLINSWSDVKLERLSHGDDDAFLQIVRSLDYSMRVLFFVAIVPYFMWAAWSYYTLAKGTDWVVTETALWYCDKPYTAEERFRMVESTPERAIVDSAFGFAASWWSSTAASFGTVGETARDHWRQASRDERLARMYNPSDSDFCGWMPMMLLTYAKLVVYGMAALIAFVYAAVLRYNFPVHYRPDSVRYVLIGPHDDYNRLSSLGDCRDSGFRSCKSDSVDFVKSPDYLVYDLTEVIDNVVRKRRVVISNAIFDKLNNPLNTVRWSCVKDYEKLEKDTLAFARAALQCVNIAPAIEKQHDMTYETAKLFCYMMRSKRVFSTNFGTPKVE